MPPIQYALRELRRNWTEPSWWRGRYERRVVGPFQQRLYGNDGVAVADRDWDNLVILDACRADLFESVFDTSRFDEYERVRSLGGSTPEWTKRNFSGNRFGNIVYVTGNPQISKYAGDAFHDLIEVWDGGFNEKYRTVLPERMTEAAIKAHTDYPNKRLIIHYMQPHTPYLERNEVFASNHGITKERLDKSAEELKTMVSEVGRETVWNAYRRTLEVALGPVEELCSALGGKTVVTSDHGELFGERVPPLFNRLYGHKTGIRYPDLVNAPWAVLGGSRRRVVDQGVSTTESDKKKIEDQLEMLGYK